MKATKYSFKGKVWKYRGPSGWHFITLPKALAKKIRLKHALNEEGWGRLPANASIASTSWRTAIWYDSKVKSYLLPIKAVVRKAQNIKSGKLVHVKLLIENEEFRFSLLPTGTQ